MGNRDDFRYSLFHVFFYFILIYCHIECKPNVKIWEVFIFITLHIYMYTSFLGHVLTGVSRQSSKPIDVMTLDGGLSIGIVNQLIFNSSDKKKKKGRNDTQIKRGKKLKINEPQQTYFGFGDFIFNGLSEKKKDYYTRKAKNTLVLEEGTRRSRRDRQCLSTRSNENDINSLPLRHLPSIQVVRVLSSLDDDDMLASSDR